VEYLQSCLEDEADMGKDPGPETLAPKPQILNLKPEILHHQPKR